MLRRMNFVVCVVAAVLSTAGVLQADTIAWDGSRVAVGTSELFTISSSLTDWWLGSGNVKSGGTAFSTSNMPSVYTELGYPCFAYTNGTSPTSATNEQATYAYGTGYEFSVAPKLNIAVPGNSSGHAAFWIGGGGTDGDYVTVQLGSQTINSVSETCPGAWLYKLDYSNTSSGAQTMTVTLQALNGGSNVGFFAGTLDVVPEPTTLVLLATGLIGLLAYAWRRRR